MKLAIIRWISNSPPGGILPNAASNIIKIEFIRSGELLEEVEGCKSSAVLIIEHGREKQFATQVRQFVKTLATFRDEPRKGVSQSFVKFFLVNENMFTIFEHLCEMLEQDQHGTAQKDFEAGETLIFPALSESENLPQESQLAIRGFEFIPND